MLCWFTFFHLHQCPYHLLNCGGLVLPVCLFVCSSRQHDATTPLLPPASTPPAHAVRSFPSVPALPPSIVCFSCFSLWYVSCRARQTCHFGCWVAAGAASHLAKRQHRRSARVVRYVTEAPLSRGYRHWVMRLGYHPVVLLRAGYCHVWHCCVVDCCYCQRSIRTCDGRLFLGCIVA